MENEVKDENKLSVRHVILLIIAGIFLIIGIVLGFTNLNVIGLKKENHGYVSALFSISGVILYFTALLYQIKQYKLQVIELRKSIEAQTKSSFELEEQRKILEEQKGVLIKQNASAQIINAIDSFNQFKSRNGVYELIEKFLKGYTQKCTNDWIAIERNYSKDNEAGYKQYALLLANNFEKELSEFDNASIIRKYVQFGYNTLYLIDKHNPILNDRHYSSLFHCQQNGPEMLILYISNIASRMPIYSNLEWGFYETKEIIEIIFRESIIDTEKTFNFLQLTKAFNEIKQND